MVKQLVDANVISLGLFSLKTTRSDEFLEITGNISRINALLNSSNPTGKYKDNIVGSAIDSPDV